VVFSTIQHDSSQHERFKNRAVSAPLISGDLFLAAADISYLPTMQPGEILRILNGVRAHIRSVFVEASAVTGYLSAAQRWTCDVSGVSTFTHIAIAHNGDSSIARQDVDLLQNASCVRMLWAQGIERGLWDPRLAAVPIGIENRYNSGLGRSPELYVALKPLLRLQHSIQWAHEIVKSMKNQRAQIFDVKSCPALAMATFSVGTNRAARCAAARALMRAPGFARLVALDGELSTLCSDAAFEQLHEDAELSEFDAGALQTMLFSEVALPCWYRPPQDGSLPVTSTTPACSASRTSTRCCSHLTPDTLSFSDVLAARGSNDMDDARKQHEFLTSLSTHPLVISPAGHGVQCHRTWEALYAGAVPVLLSEDSPVDRLYDGLPVALLSSWEDLVPPSDRSDKGRYAYGLGVGILYRIGIALFNTLRVFELRQKQRDLNTAGRCAQNESATALRTTARDPACDFIFRHHSPSFPSEKFAYSDNLTPSSAGNKPCLHVETFSFDPTLAAIPTSKLTAFQQYRLSRSVLTLDKLYSDYWLQALSIDLKPANDR
jgi:hypothetical protein